MRRWLPFLLLTLLAPGLWAGGNAMGQAAYGYEIRNGSADPMGYVDGMSLYAGYFAPNGLDPLGLADLENTKPNLINPTITPAPVTVVNPDTPVYAPSGPITYVLQPNYIPGTPGVIAGGKYIQLQGDKPTGLIFDPAIEERSPDDRLMDILTVVTAITPAGGARSAASIGCKVAEKPAMNLQKLAGHIPGTPQYASRLAGKKLTSTFFNQSQAESVTNEAWLKGARLGTDGKMRLFKFGEPVGVGPAGGGYQTQVRVSIDASGKIHGTPWGPVYQGPLPK